MALIRNSKLRPRILVVGGGYLGLVTAQNLLKNLGRGEATVTVIDPNPYMTYQPFLPEVVGGHIDGRNVVVDHATHLKDSEVLRGAVVKVEHARRVATVRGEDGRITRWFGTCTDIHDQKMAENALRLANQRKDDFLAMLAHELRNPLAPIRNDDDVVPAIAAALTAALTTT